MAETLLIQTTRECYISMERRAGGIASFYLTAGRQGETQQNNLVIMAFAANAVLRPLPAATRYQRTRRPLPTHTAITM